jgi:pyruvate dehydrogenase E2 component (dihydrolipoamide acetyltransferase)
MEIEVKVPEMEGVEALTITYWYHKEGEVVKEGEDLVELATEKATFNLPAPASGKLIKRNFNEGDTVKIGDVLAIIEKEEGT